LSALVLSACASTDGPSAWTFDAPLGSPPDGWRVETTNPEESATPDEPARWEIRADATAPSPPAALVLVDTRGGAGDAYHLCWTDSIERAEVDLTVAVRAGGGEEDAGGGPAWRIAGADDYYLCRWNPLEYNFRLYYVAGGHRVQLADATVYADLADWHVIGVKHVGEHIECSFDGRALLVADDATHTGSGGVGVWTKADATTAFDDLTLR